MNRRGVASPSLAMNNSTVLVPFVASTFHVADYVVFAAFLALSGAVGVFFSVRGQRNTQEYFLGGRQMRPVPVGISTGVSFMSAASLVGMPAETYINGYSYIISLVPASLGFFFGCVTIASVLQPLKMSSVSEYLRRRYNSRLITLATNVVVLLCILEYMGVCMLGSVIAFSSVTGGAVSVVSGLAIGCIVGVFYTTIGGMKAVVWSDVLQFGFMLVGILAVIVSSIADTPGGLAEIARLGVHYQRLHAPELRFDLTVRHTLWGLLVGIFFGWLVWCVQPACVQRLCCTASKRDAYIVSAIAASIFCVLSFLPAWAGLNIFGFYASRGCDVFAAGWISNNDIILYYVRERLAHPGFQGLFVAALYAGSLSSLSSGLNAASSILWKDTVQPLLRTQVSERRATLISKAIVVVFGVVSMLWCYALHSFGGLIIQMMATIDASMYGAYFSVFALSILCAHATWKGALAGMVVSFSFTLWIGMGSLMSGKAAGGRLPTIVDRCAVNGTEKAHNLTTPSPTPAAACGGQTVIQTLYSVSYEWLSLICLLLSLGLALMVIGWTGPRPGGEVEAEMLVSWMRPGFFRCRRPDASESGEAATRGSKEELKKLKTCDA